MKEEDKLKETFGTDNPFRVPEGYFEQLTSEVMNRLPEKAPAAPIRRPTMWEKVRPWVYMAAMFVGAALIIRVASTHYDAATAEPIATVSDEDTEIEYIDMAMQNVMMDDYSLYVYIADAVEE